MKKKRKKCRIEQAHIELYITSWPFEHKPTTIIIILNTNSGYSLLLTRTELDFLLERREFTKPQKRCIRSRLHKKVKEFAVADKKKKKKEEEVNLLLR